MSVGDCIWDSFHGHEKTVFTSARTGCRQYFSSRLLSVGPSERLPHAIDYVIGRRSYDGAEIDACLRGQLSHGPDFGIRRDDGGYPLGRDGLAQERVSGSCVTAWRGKDSSTSWM